MRRGSARHRYLVSASILAALGLSALWDRAVLAAGDCITEPNRQAAKGGHWYYHVEPVNRRKCWYVARQPLKVAPAQSVKRRSSQNPDDEGSQTKPAVPRSDTPAAALENDRDALFQEFLQWRERQNEHDPSFNQASRDALFREFVLWQILRTDAEH